MEQTEYGLTAANDGWFVVNVRQAAWMTNEYFGEACVFEGDAVAFPDVGYTTVYVRSELALGHGASIESEARPSDRPYVPFPKWQPGPPASFDGLPFG